MNYTDIIDKLYKTNTALDDELASLIEANNSKASVYLRQKADEKRQEIYGMDVYIRGLIEFTNYCKNDCYYCGIRCSNRKVQRYRLSKEEILDCCVKGYDLGFRTFVLQGGEDPHYTDDILCSIISSIKKMYKDCAVTLSLGERSYESYKRLYDAGADRYLLRHETADENHYKKLHPNTLSLENRMKCLYNLKNIGYQVGSGFMVDSPYQTTDCLISDLRFLQKLDPDMIGIGPFISHKDTPFHSCKSGMLNKTLRIISVLRLMFPQALIPATTALGTISPSGREEGLKSGANVVMPNLSPTSVRKKYELYDNKICTGEESASCIGCLTDRVKSAGYNIVTDIGHRKR